MGGRFKREVIYAYLWLIHVVVWQKPTQHCKAVILKLKINFCKRKLKWGNHPGLSQWAYTVARILTGEKASTEKETGRCDAASFEDGGKATSQGMQL